MESINQIPIHPDCLKTGTHFHVIFGEESVFWHGSDLIQGPIFDLIFDGHEKAHRFFIKQINALLPGYISEEEVTESLIELGRLIAYPEYDESSTKTTEGIWFEELDIKLAVCHRCIPVHQN